MKIHPAIEHFRSHVQFFLLLMVIATFSILLFTRSSSSAMEQELQTLRSKVSALEEQYHQLELRFNHQSLPLQNTTENHQSSESADIQAAAALGQQITNSTENSTNNNSSVPNNNSSVPMNDSNVNPAPKN